MLNDLLQLDFVEPVLLIKNGNVHSKKSFFEKISSYPYRHLVYRLGSRIKKHQQQSLTQLPQRLVSVKSISCKTVKKGKYNEYFSEQDIATIRLHQPDFILRFGFNIIKGDILTLARYGVWSYHHGDEQKYRGGPPCFWEVYNNETSCGAILQRLTEKLDGGIILKKGYYEVTNHSWRQTLNSVYDLSSFFVRQVCTDIHYGHADYLTNTASSSTAKIYTYPGNFRTLAYSFKKVGRKINFHWNDLFKTEFWKIGVLKQEVQSVIKSGVTEKINWIQHEDKNSYLADVFGYEENGKLILVAEDYSYKDGKGKIRRIDFSTGEKRYVQTTANHYSYPFTFKHDEKKYILPECSTSGKISLYEIDSEGNWINEKILLTNVKAFDPSLVKWNNQWWLFFTRKEFHSSTCLFIFHSDQIDGPYHSHVNNPVKVDIGSARMAGNFVEQFGELYRLAQNCDGTYGKSVKAFKINALSATQFNEELLSELSIPDCQSCYKGFHTVSYSENHVFADIKYYRFCGVNFKRKLLKKLRLSKNQHILKLIILAICNNYEFNI